MHNLGSLCWLSFRNVHSVRRFLRYFISRYFSLILLFKELISFRTSSTVRFFYKISLVEISQLGFNVVISCPANPFFYDSNFWILYKITFSRWTSPMCVIRLSLGKKITVPEHKIQVCITEVSNFCTLFYCKTIFRTIKTLKTRLSRKDTSVKLKKCSSAI